MIVSSSNLILEHSDFLLNIDQNELNLNFDFDNQILSLKFDLHMQYRRS